MRKLVLTLAVSLAALAGGAHAQAPSGSGPDIHVRLGPVLEKRTTEFGVRELDDLRADLRDQVTHALARSSAAPARVELVIEDAAPNRPTMEQMGRTPGLSLRSVGVGGARVSGVITYANGSTRPLRYQWYETDITQERAASTWSDAERSFGFLADQLGRGRVPDAYQGPGPSADGGSFGYPRRGY